MLGVLAARAWADADAWRITGVRRRGPWRWSLLAYLLVPALLLAGAVVCVLAGVQQVDPTFSVLRQTFERAGQAPPEPLAAFAALIVLLSFGGAPINVLATIGEEVGWRGYLLARPQPLGPRRAALIIGLIWGLWHAPIIAMGFDYPGALLLGPLLMTGLTLGYGVLLVWLRARSGSMWPAALAHGALNAEGSAIAVFLSPADRLGGAVAARGHPGGRSSGEPRFEPHVWPERARRRPEPARRSPS